MPIEIANIPLPRVHRVVSQERADFISHRIPGLAGNVVQDMGRQSVRLRIDGIFYGAKAINYALPLNMLDLVDFIFHFAARCFYYHNIAFFFTD